jgi:hypothetical protein
VILRVDDKDVWEFIESEDLWIYGKQVLAVEGFRNSERLDRFSKWQRCEDVLTLPDFLVTISNKYEWLNVLVTKSLKCI